MMGLLALLIQECLFFLGYVTGSQQYPKPLTRREEAKLLAEMAEGSEEARRELILHNLRLVAHIARKYTVPGHNAEDLTSIGVVGLIKAVGSYRCGGGTSLGTYAARCIENAIPSPTRFRTVGGCLQVGKCPNGMFWSKFPSSFTSFA